MPKGIYRRTKPAWNKGLKKPTIHFKKCLICFSLFGKIPHFTLKEWGERKFCSYKCYWEDMKRRRNEKTSNWKGDNVQKSAVHRWLNVNYGKPQICEGMIGIKHKGISSNFDWALKSFHEYKKIRDNFLRLCRSCHKRYDMARIKKEKENV